MKIVIDQEKCIGCGSCAVVCDKYLELDGDNDNKAYFKANKGNELEIDDLECIQEAIDICPIQAIEIKE